MPVTMSLEERRKKNTEYKRAERLRKREEAERAQSLGSRLRKENRKDSASDEQLVEQWSKVHAPEAEKLYFAKILRVHREIAKKLGVTELPNDTLHSFTRRVIEASNADSPDSQIVWNIQIPDRPIVTGHAL